MPSDRSCDRPAGNSAWGCYIAAVLRPLLFLALGLSSGACSEPGSADTPLAASATQREEMPRPESKPFSGWGPFTFGMDFDDALTAYPGVAWQAESLRRCRVEMPSRGCTLIPAEESRVPRTAGVALLPVVSFNREGKLSAIALRSFLRGDVRPAHCGRAHGQLLHHLNKTWGSPAASSSDAHEMQVRSVPGGRELLPGTRDGAVIGRETFHVQPDGRRVILLSRYIGATASAPAVCHLSIYYRGPNSLQPPPEERPHPLKNWY